MIEKDEEKSHWLGPQRPKECYGGEFPGFCFCLIYPRIGTEKAGNLELPVGTNLKGPTKASSL